MGRDYYVAGRSPSQIADDRGFQIDGGRHKATVLTAAEDRKSVCMGGLTPPPQPPRPHRSFSHSLRTARGPRSRWRLLLASMALNDDALCFLPSSFSCLLHDSRHIHFNPALRRAAV